MVKSFAAALAAIALVAALGYALRDRLFGGAPAVAPVAAAPRALADAGVSPDAAPVDRRTVVVDLHGTVEKQVGERWVAIGAGDRLLEQDTIRTGDGASAHLQTGDQLVELGDRSEVTVGEISASVADYMLAEGRVTATTGERGRAIRIETRGTDAVAESASGRFDVASTGAGQVAVAAEHGDVQVSAHGTRVAVHAGEQTVVAAGATPAAPSKIPPSLFLKVSAAGGGRDPVAALHGETAPGAVVSINGTRTMADDRGGFTSHVALAAGDNVIVVSVEDATGRATQKVIKRSLDRSGPKVSTEVDWR